MLSESLNSNEGHEQRVKMLVPIGLSQSFPVLPRGTGVVIRAKAGIAASVGYRVREV